MSDSDRMRFIPVAFLFACGVLLLAPRASAACLPDRTGHLTNGTQGCTTSFDCCDGICVPDPGGTNGHICCGAEGEGCATECIADKPAAPPACGGSQVCCSGTCETINSVKECCSGIVDLENGNPLVPCTKQADCCGSQGAVTCVNPNYTNCSGTDPDPDCFCCVNDNQVAPAVCATNDECCDDNAATTCHTAVPFDGVCCRDTDAQCDPTKANQCCGAYNNGGKNFAGEECNGLTKTCCAFNGGVFACTHPSDCCSGVCTSGSCTQCTKNSDCTAGSDCCQALIDGAMSGVCEANASCSNSPPGPCSADSDCSTGYCNPSGQCAVCTADSQCGSGQLCCGGSCTTATCCLDGSGATKAVDCCAGLVLVNGVCSNC
jgi:hypothetical protein